MWFMQSAQNDHAASLYTDPLSINDLTVNCSRYDDDRGRRAIQLFADQGTENQYLVGFCQNEGGRGRTKPHRLGQHA